ncbi:MAG: hypothetical protein WCH78_07955 [Bacteroidota bacterium]
MQFIKSIMLLPLFSCLLLLVQAQSDWPKEIPISNSGKITIYQPQPEKLEGVKLFGRAAVSVRKNANDEPVFGAIWVEAMLNTDKDKGTATLESLKVVQTKFPGIADATQLSELAAAIEKQVPAWNLTISMERLKNSIHQEQQIENANFKTDPPKIIYTKVASTLIIIDGEPKIQQDKNLNMERVINSPSLIIKNPDDKKFYLYGGGNWYTSSAVTTGYQSTKNLPSKIKAVDAKLKEQEAAAEKNKEPIAKNTTPTEIIISTVPAELIQTEGEASFKPIQGTSLLYADNTLDEIFKDINSQKNFILLAGRWYSSSSMNGPWNYIAADKLPADFAKIPEGSEKDGVLASVAGTDAAEEAKADAVIPQTAKIDRSTAKCTVTYDGDPKFSAIENTSLYVADNSSITVIKAKDKYFAVDNGVWFQSKQATGPWVVSDERPTDVDKIPASSAAYNTKYVYIYESTPQYIYTGYTPGYMGGYLYGPTVIWGTGWYYRPWYGAMYYPRPVTFGFGMSYNPYTGWGMSYGMSFNAGWFHFGIGFGGYGYGGGWFGPPMYRPPYGGWGYHGGYYGGGYGRPGGGNNIVINNPNININRPYNNINNRPGNNRPGSNNLYNNRRDVISTNNVDRRPGGLATSRPTQNGNNRLPSLNSGNNNFNRPSARPSTGGSNNVLSDRDGNIFQKDNKGNWNQRDGNKWNPKDKAGVPNDVHRDNSNRDRANRMENNQQWNRPQTSPSRPSTPQTRPSAPQSRPAAPQQGRPSARPTPSGGRGRIGGR